MKDYYESTLVPQGIKPNVSEQVSLPKFLFLTTSEFLKSWLSSMLVLTSNHVSEIFDDNSVILKGFSK